MTQRAFAAAALASAAAFSIGKPSAASAQARDTLKLSIAQAVSRAVAQGDELAQGNAAVDAADAQVVTARAAGLPQLRLNTTYSHAYENARAQAVGQVFNQPNTYNTNLNFSQSLFQGGRIGAASRAAQLTRSASRLDVEELKQRVSVDAQRAYLNVLYTERVVAIQTANLTLAQARLDNVTQLEDAGRAARFDVLRAQVEKSNIEPLVIQAANDRDLAVLELKRLLNIPIAQPVALTTTLDPAAVRAFVASLPAADLDPSTAPDRGTLRSAEMAASARHEAIKIAKADLFPTLTLTFQSGYQAFPPPGGGFPFSRGAASGAFCNPPETTRVCQNGGWFSDRTLGATVSWPVFDGLRARGNIQLARAQSRLADAQLQQTREAVNVEAARARAELARARATFDARQKTVEQATEAFQLATLRNSRGVGTTLEVSDAQLAMVTAQTGEARATYDLYLAAAELARSLGRPVPLPPA